MEPLITFSHIFLSTVKDVFPVIALLVFFQLVVLRKPFPHWKRAAIGFMFVVIGLAFFLNGLETALFPIGRIMAQQLSSPEFVFGSKNVPVDAGWSAYWWVYLFGALIGFATTVAEPALIAVSFKAQEVSRGGLSQWGLRLAVATGVAIGIAIGTFRIVTGTPLHIYIIAGVPLIAALGLGLSQTIPGRNPLVDGFGLIAFASVFPIITVIGYAQIARWSVVRRLRITKEG
jgi:hypothetical protein